MMNIPRSTGRRSVHSVTQSVLSTVTSEGMALSVMEGGPHSFFLYFSGYSSSTSAAVIEDFEMFVVLNSKLPDPACKRRQSPILMVVPSRALNNVDFPIPLIKFSCVVTGMELSDYNDRAKHYGQQHKKNCLIVPCAMNISTVMKKGIICII